MRKHTDIPNRLFNCSNILQKQTPMKKVNLTTYPTKNQIQLIRANPKIQRAMVESKSWESLRNLILSKVITTNDVLYFFEQKYKNN